MRTYQINEDTATGVVCVSHYETRAELTKTGAPRKDGRTIRTVVIDAEHTGPHRHLEASATHAELTGNPAEAQRIRANIAAETTQRPDTRPADDFLAALMAL